MIDMGPWCVAVWPLLAISVDAFSYHFPSLSKNCHRSRVSTRRQPPPTPAAAGLPYRTSILSFFLFYFRLAKQVYKSIKYKLILFPSLHHQDYLGKFKRSYERLRPNGEAHLVEET